jgi:hypothetical protein
MSQYKFHENMQKYYPNEDLNKILENRKFIELKKVSHEKRGDTECICNNTLKHVYIYQDPNNLDIVFGLGLECKKKLKKNLEKKKKSSSNNNPHPFLKLPYIKIANINIYNLKIKCELLLDYLKEQKEDIEECKKYYLILKNNLGNENYNPGEIREYINENIKYIELLERYGKEEKELNTLNNYIYSYKGSNNTIVHDI